MLNKHKLFSSLIIILKSFVNSRLYAKHLLLIDVTVIPLSALLVGSLMVLSGATGVSHEAGLDFGSPGHSHRPLNH